MYTEVGGPLARVRGGGGGGGGGRFIREPRQATRRGELRDSGSGSERERERERERFIRNNLHNGVVSGAANLAADPPF